MSTMSMGGNISLSATAVRASLRWTPAPGVPDIDASALLLTTAGVVGGDADFVFYNQPQHPSGSVRMAGRQTGAQAADHVDVDLDRVPAATERIVLTASAAAGTFGQVPGLELLLADRTTGTALAVFPMHADAETAFVCAELYRRNGAWKFRAVGQGYASGLAGLAADFGIEAGGSPAAAAPAPPPAPSNPPPAALAPAPASLDLGTPAPPPAAAPASLDLAPPAPPPAPPSAPPSAPPTSAPAAPRVSSATALDLDAPWPPPSR